jgi:uncharacterized metal-binding protein YceD (DUF177 family)
MGNPLRDRRTPLEWAESGQNIDFSDKITAFERLAGIVRGDLEILDPDKLPLDWRDRIVAGRLSFGFSGAQGGVVALKGEVATTIDAVCQRCLRAIRVPLRAEMKFLFAADESALVVDDGYEVWELEEEKLRPLDLVEEALIMSIPLAVMHDNDERCQSSAAPVADPGEKTRPFASLRARLEDEN